MNNHQWLDQQAGKTRERLFPRIRSRFSDFIERHPDDWRSFEQRLDEHFPLLFGLYFDLYHQNYDFFFHLEDLLERIAGYWIARRPALKDLDLRRLSNPVWFSHSEMFGGVCYVDLFAENLAGLTEKITYFKEFGITYLHLMPLYKSPALENDGGYAVSSYREVDPRLGTLDDLIGLADALRGAGISLALDFVFNHTSNEHEWAKRAVAGETEFRDFYWLFPDRTLPDAYDQTLREIFPQEHPGSFTYYPTIDRWIWTTFHSYQWDLNYQNPAVLNNMVGEMLFLANLGVEVLRLDALAFLWKEMGTSCENLPQTHLLIQVFNTAASIAAPALVFKSEAIVHPDEVVKYVHPGECELSYNPLIMALLWESLATRKVELLKKALEERLKIPPGTAWVNYVRSHDDIGWTFSDEDAAMLGINAYDHRQFLNEFYTGRFPGSFARGIPFQENPKTGDARISGTTASLAGLEAALDDGNEYECELAIRRIVLLHSVILSLGGIPLIFLGDEVGQLNDYSYLEDPKKAFDSRWVHRPKMDWDRVELRSDPESPEGQIFQRLSALVELRMKKRVLSQGDFTIVDSKNPHVLTYWRADESDQILLLANFSESAETAEITALPIGGPEERGHQEITLEPFEFRLIDPN